MNISRKEFLKQAAVLTGGLIVLPAATNLAGCTASAVEPDKVLVSPDGIIKYNTAGKFKNAGDSGLFELSGTEVSRSGSKIILIRKDTESFTALNPVCTHRGCELAKKKNFLECPCHGSEFDFTGKVLKGPASEPLQSFKTEYDGKNTLTIFLR